MSDEIKKQLGKRLKQLREQKGLTQEALAELVDVNVNSLSYIERGINFIKSDTLDKICNALNISPKQLFDFDYNPLPGGDLKKILHKMLDENPDKLNDIYKILNGFLN